RQQRRPAELARLIHVRARLDQQLRGLEVPFARREDQRRETAPVGGLRAIVEEAVVLDFGFRFGRVGLGGGRRGFRRGPRGRRRRTGLDPLRQDVDRLGERRDSRRERIELRGERDDRLVSARLGVRILTGRLPLAARRSRLLAERGGRVGDRVRGL